MVLSCKALECNAIQTCDEKPSLIDLSKRGSDTRDRLSPLPPCA